MSPTEQKYMYVVISYNTTNALLYSVSYKDGEPPEATLDEGFYAHMSKIFAPKHMHYADSIEECHAAFLTNAEIMTGGAVALVRMSEATPGASIDLEIHGRPVTITYRSYLRAEV